MKKQLLLILTLTIFIVSFSSSAFAQLAPRPVTCLTGDALHPIAGNPYTYEVNVPTPPGTKEYTWIVTQDQTFVTAGALVATETPIGGPILAAGSGWYGVANASTNDNISLTWQSIVYDPLNPVFVVIFVTNLDPTPGCTSQNVKVYKIEPQNAFTLDIANMNQSLATQTGYGTNIDICISDIASAVYDANAPEGVTMDYGVSYLYYEVVAANWSEAWNLSVQLTNVDPLEHVTVEWTYDETFAGGFNAMAGSAVGTGGTPTVYTSATDIVPQAPAVGFVGSAGQSIYIRVTLDHSDLTVAGWEGLTNQAIALAVDGITVPTSGTGIGDIHTVAGGGPPAACPWVDLFANDVANQTLQSRPDIQSATDLDPLVPVVIGPFLPVKP